VEVLAGTFLIADVFRPGEGFDPLEGRPEGLARLLIGDPNSFISSLEGSSGEGDEDSRSGQLDIFPSFSWYLDNAPSPESPLREGTEEFRLSDSEATEVSFLRFSEGGYGHSRSASSPASRSDKEIERREGYSSGSGSTTRSSSSSGSCERGLRRVFPKLTFLGLGERGKEKKVGCRENLVDMMGDVQVDRTVFDESKGMKELKEKECCWLTVRCTSIVLEKVEKENIQRMEERKMKDEEKNKTWSNQLA
jgi:hypothetical protein